jgi:hypothetical protein
MSMADEGLPTVNQLKEAFCDNKDALSAKHMKAYSLAWVWSQKPHLLQGHVLKMCGQNALVDALPSCSQHKNYEVELMCGLGKHFLTLCALAGALHWRA